MLDRRDLCPKKVSMPNNLIFHIIELKISGPDWAYQGELFVMCRPFSRSDINLRRHLVIGKPSPTGIPQPGLVEVEFCSDFSKDLCAFHLQTLSYECSNLRTLEYNNFKPNQHLTLDMHL